VTPLISAICLTRFPQRSDMLVEAMHSFALQTHSNRELVIVNDGKPLVPAAAGVTVVNLPTQQTIGAKRNVGTAAARGDFFAPWDDDDFSMPERMELQLAQINRERTASVRSSLIWLATADLRVHGLFKSTNYQTSLISRDEANRVGGYPDLNYLEDMELDIRLRLRGLRFSYEPGFFYIHRRHTMNVSNPHEGGGRHFLNMIPSPDTDRVNARLAALRALPRGTLLTTPNGSALSVPESVPERVPAPTAPASWAGR
jgi:glycosyltransferase involved in cell wall biosynthesis